MEKVHTDANILCVVSFGFFLLQKDVRDIFTPVEFEVSYSHSETSTQRGNGKAFPPLKPILQQSSGHVNRITNQVPGRYCTAALPATTLFVVSHRNPNLDLKTIRFLARIYFLLDLTYHLSLILIRHGLLDPVLWWTVPPTCSCRQSWYSHSKKLTHTHTHTLVFPPFRDTHKSYYRFFTLDRQKG